MKKICFIFGILLLFLSIFLSKLVIITPNILDQNTFEVLTEQYNESYIMQNGIMSICKNCKKVLNIEHLKYTNQCKRCSTNDYQYTYQNFIVHLEETKDLNISSVKEYFDYYHLTAIYISILITITMISIFLIGRSIYLKIKG